MSRSRSFEELSNIKDFQNFVAKASDVISNLHDTVNGKLDFSTNMNCQQVTVTFSATGTDTAVNHSLGFVPTGYFRHGGTSNGVVTDGNTKWTNTTIYLQCTQTGTAKITIF